MNDNSPLMLGSALLAFGMVAFAGLNALAAQIPLHVAALLHP